MIRRTKEVVSYPSRTVIEDLLLRDGPATDKDFTPFNGCADIIDEQFKGSLKSSFKLQQVLNDNNNNDFAPSRVTKRNTFGELEEKLDEKEGFKVLEDCIIDGVEHPAVRNFIKSLLIGLKVNNSSSLVKGKERMTMVFTNDDDGEEEEEKMSIIKVNDEDISNDDYEAIIAELPHIMLSIWSISKRYRANLFTFIFAYYDIVSQPDKNVNNVTVTDFSRYELHRIKTDGSFNGVFSHADNIKGDIYRDALDIFVVPSKHTVEYSLCEKLINMIDTLGIDYKYEDPTSYNKEYIESIICTYLQSNDEYFKEYREVDKEILKALEPQNILSVLKKDLYSPIKQQFYVDYTQSVDYISDRLLYALREDMSDPVISKLLIKREADAKALYMCLKAKKQETIEDENLLRFEGNYLLYYNKDLVLIDGKEIGLFDGSNSYKCVLTVFGFPVIIKHSLDEEFYYIDNEDFYKIVEAIINGNGEDVREKEANWKRLQYIG